MADREEAEYRQRAVVYVRGRAALTVYSCGEIDERLVRYCLAILEGQLAGCPDALLNQMAWRKAEVALVGRGYKSRRPLKLSDVPGLQHIRGTPTDFAWRVVGVCKTWGSGPPIAAVLNLAGYLPETLIHEVGHMAMDCGLLGLGSRRSADRLRDICDKHAAAKAEKLYSQDVYIMKNEKEYFACSTTSWFDVGRWDQTLRFAHGYVGVTTRKALKAQDPRGAAMMEQVWGDSEWRPRDVPRPPQPPMRWRLPGWPRAREEPLPPLPPPPQLSMLQRLEHVPRPVLEEGTLTAARVGMSVGIAYATLRIAKWIIQK